MSIRIVGQKSEADKIIPMSEMKPLQAGMITGNIVYSGTIVLRTAATDKFEVIDLSSPRRNGYWENSASLKVRLFTEPITIEIDGKES